MRVVTESEFNRKINVRMNAELNLIRGSLSVVRPLWLVLLGPYANHAR